MNKIIGVVSVIAVIGAIVLFAKTSEAAVECTTGDHKVYNASNTEVVSCIPAADWERATKVVLGEIKNLVRLAKGEVYTLWWGYTTVCPEWYPSGCVIAPELLKR